MAITIDPGISIGAGVVISPAPIVAPRIPHTVTANANAQISTAQVKFGTGSFTSNGNVGWLNVTPASNLAFGTGNFTVEFWHYPTALTGYQAYFGQRPYSTNGAYPVLVMNNNGSGTLQYYMGGFKITTTTALTVNAWNSVALVRNGTTTAIYINGTNAGQWAADSTNYLASTCIFFGDDYFGGNGLPIKGYADEIRISNVARYTGNYVPATEPFVNDNNTWLLIHCDGTNGSTVFTDSTAV